MKEEGTKKFSPEAREVWEALNEKTRKAIQKDNPFRKDRDRAIRNLGRQGVKFHVLAEITGMSRNGIFLIIHRGEASGADIPEGVNQRLKVLQSAFEAFFNAVLKILSVPKRR
ncbi:MAG: hypothetical protein JXD19_07665 [Deltaproteobacteria bacterium]|nr:hypothetical protein [Deltaproteobacteria bacterium]